MKTKQDQADGAGVVNSFALCVGDWSSRKIGRVTRATLEERRFVLADGRELLILKLTLVSDEGVYCPVNGRVLIQRVPGRASWTHLHKSSNKALCYSLCSSASCSRPQSGNGRETPSQLTPGAVERLAKPRLSGDSDCACTS